MFHCRSFLRATGIFCLIPICQILNPSDRQFGELLSCRALSAHYMAGPRVHRTTYRELMVVKIWLLR